MKLDKVAEKLGFQQNSGVYSRMYNGYEVSLVLHRINSSLVKYPMLMFVFNHSIDKADFKRFPKSIKFRGLFKESVGLKNNAVLTSAGFKNQEKLDAFLEKITLVFEELELKQLVHCPYCGKEDTDSIRVVKGAIVHVHDSCVKDFVEKVTTHLNTVGSSKTHLVKSIIFAVIGGFIGLIPSIILLMAANFYTAWLFMLIPFAAFYGFKKGGAQKGSYVMIIIALISLIMAPGFMVFAYFSVAVYLEVTFSELLSDPEFLGAFTRDMGMTIIFTLIAIWASWKYIFKQTHGQIKKDIQDLKD